MIAVRLVIGTFGSRGGRLITSGSPGSTAMTTTPADGHEEEQEQHHRSG